MGDRLACARLMQGLHQALDIDTQAIVWEALYAYMSSPNTHSNSCTAACYLLLHGGRSSVVAGNLVEFATAARVFELHALDVDFVCFRRRDMVMTFRLVN